ncbi:HIRAN domain-containing protein [Cellulomonas sp. Y8]|uniref:HIRAN domain-containing protein n=1 Tax=Cellulomonas sp. Y8 TaxID=2591145 RepID=UPI003D763A13
MSTTTAADPSASGATPSQHHGEALVVAWQHPVERSIRPIGLLRHDHGVYSFRYIEEARTVGDFRPLLGFEDLDREYRSEHLFPIFAQRAMDARRPDYAGYVRDLGLDPETATPWEQITRSEGRRHGDVLQLFPVPQVRSGRVRCAFFVHGIRHMPNNEPQLGDRVFPVTPGAIEDAITHLSSGDPLELMAEPSNTRNPDAVVVLAHDVPLGYVPDLLAHDLTRLMARTSVRASVVRVNAPDAPGHQRLLAQVAADGVGDFQFFQDARWNELGGPAQ